MIQASESVAMRTCSVKTTEINLKSSEIHQCLLLMASPAAVSSLLAEFIELLNNAEYQIRSPGNVGRCETHDSRTDQSNILITR
jgi:hypothetical protein